MYVSYSDFEDLNSTLVGRFYVVQIYAMKPTKNKAIKTVFVGLLKKIKQSTCTCNAE